MGTVLRKVGGDSGVQSRLGAPPPRGWWGPAGVLELDPSSSVPSTRKMCRSLRKLKRGQH